MMQKERLYWLGNAAKARILDDILARLRQGRETLIFDYGCGDGGDWASILSDFPSTRLIGYEPVRNVFERARERLSGLNAELYTGEGLGELNFKADFIVSFSVLEHVYERRVYLKTAKQHLIDDGVFYLNYDDGHFRNYLDLNQPGLWLASMKEWAHNQVAGLLARLGWVYQYQGRVRPDELEVLLNEAGFKVIQVLYGNLESFKSLQKAIPGEKQQDFFRYWLETEEALTSRFCDGNHPVDGDRASLWRWKEMSSRTLTLKHKDQV